MGEGLQSTYRVDEWCEYNDGWRLGSEVLSVSYAKSCAQSLCDQGKRARVVSICRAEIETYEPPTKDPDQ